MKGRLTILSPYLFSAMVATGCHSQLHPHNLPPAQQLMHPGPGVGGPGPGVLMRGAAAGTNGAYGWNRSAGATSQLWFVRPQGMTVRWDAIQHGGFDSEPLVVPGRQNFPQGALYRLKLTQIPGHEGMELYPTIEIGGSTPRTDAFLAHTPIPVEFTEEDFDQVDSGNYVTKVIFLPDPEFQELALAGVETLVSTRLDPGVDPIAEADRRGAILAIVRLGNKDLELPGLEAAAGGSYVVPASHSDVTSAAQSGVIPAGGGPLTAHSPMGMPTGSVAPPAMPPQFVSGVTGPQWGMPMSGTPIGLPGPPHVPLGGPAGLQKHVIKNHTRQHLPHPTEKFRIDVKQRPGFSYPKPASHVRIDEHVKAPWKGFHTPWGNHREIVR